MADTPQDPQNAASRRTPLSTPAARLSALELGAQRGLGPLSPLVNEVWHGESQPCPSCGELNRRGAEHCMHCEQDLTPAMLRKMRAHAGPWYVHEHVRPFPGVTLERLIRQIRRGVLTPTTIVRGPTTFHQWRYAAETPGLSKYLGRCWNCQAKVTANLQYCPECDYSLDTPPRLSTAPEDAEDLPALTTAAPPPSGAPFIREPMEEEQSSPASPIDVSAELSQLAQAFQTAGIAHEADSDQSRRKRPFPAWTIIVVMLGLALAGLIITVRLRGAATTPHRAHDTTEASRATMSPTPASSVMSAAMSPNEADFDANASADTAAGPHGGVSSDGVTQPAKTAEPLESEGPAETGDEAEPSPSPRFEMPPLPEPGGQ